MPLETEIEQLALDVERLSNNIDTFDNTVEELSASLRDQHSNISALASAVTELATAVRDQRDSAPVAITNNFTDTGAGTYSGFNEGDEVVYVGSIYKEGLKAKVKFHTARTFRDGEVPVVRADNNQNDVWPARSTILASSLRFYARPKTQPRWYHQTPSGDHKTWNIRVLEEAATEGLTVRFVYEKPAERFAPSWSSERTTRVVEVKKFNRLGFNDADAIVSGIDTNVSSGEANRNFRLDRIQGYVTVVEED